MMENETQAVAIARRLGSDVLGWYAFDAVFEEGHQSDLEVTDNPVETGVVVSDHAYMKPLQLTLKAGVSDTPLNDLESQGDPFASDTGRAQRAYELLTALQAKAEPFDVQTGLKLYKNMVCTSIRTNQDKDTDSVLIFEATLREVLIVTTKTVKYPPRKKGTTQRQASKKQDAGEQQGKEVAADKSSSMGVKVLNVVKGFVK